MSRRSANGEGTVYRRKDGRYEASGYFFSPVGPPIRRRFYGSTRKEARDKLLAAQAQVTQGIPLPSKSWKLGEYLDHWLANIVRPNVRSSTYERYEVIVRLYLRPALGRYKLTDLSVPLVSTFLNHHLANGKSVRNVQIMRAVLRAALTAACREELLSRNVAALVRLPKWEQGEIKPWSADEARAFLAAAESDPLYPAFVLLVHYGLRRGEVLGIRWQDIDADQGVLRIRQQVRRSGGKLEVGPLKTRAGRRDLPLLHAVMRVLPEEPAFEPSDLVFTTSAGNPVEPHNLARSFHRICEQHNIRRIRLHDVRHTTATLLKDSGVPARDAQLILGHSTIAITQEIYQHDDLTTRRNALEKVERLFLRSTGFVDVAVKNGRQATNSLYQLLCFNLAGETGLEPATPGFGALLPTLGDSRFAAVTLSANARRVLWILGCVAVTAAVKSRALRLSETA